MRLEKILAAIDGSEASNIALDYAASLARNFSASLTIITVQEPLTPPPPPTLPPDVIEPYLKEVKAFHKAILDKALNRVLEANKKLKVSTLLLRGRAAEGIVKECKNGGYDLLVMGSRGLGGIKGLILGSVSKKVVEEAPCPVLIVKSAGVQ